MCTVFAKNTSKGVVAARNHSWCQLGGNLHFIPAKRLYGKVVNAMYLMDQWGQDRPFEGINEHGLLIGCAGFPDDLSPLGKQKSKPHGLDIFGIIRYALERAKSTAEALEILRSTPISHQQGQAPGTTGYNVRAHYLIADPTGQVASWAEEENCFRRRLSVGKGFPMTNFPLSFKAEDCDRYDILKKGMDSVRGPRSAMQLLEKAQQVTTLWSCVYDLKRLTMELCIDLDYDFSFRFDFRKKIAEGERHLGFGELRLWEGYNHPREKEFSIPKKLYHTAEQLKQKAP